MLSDFLLLILIINTYIVQDMHMLEPVEVSPQPRICSYEYAPSHCGYAPARTSYDGYAPMDMPLPTVDMPLPGPSMTDMLLWICSFLLCICPGQDMLPVCHWLESSAWHNSPTHWPERLVLSADWSRLVPLFPLFPGRALLPGGL